MQGLAGVCTRLLRNPLFKSEVRGSDEGGRYCCTQRCWQETNRSGKRTRQLLVVSSAAVLTLAKSADFGDAAVTELPGVGARKGGEAGDEEIG